MRIKGEYIITITLQNMFHTYQTVMCEGHNLVTDDGMELMMKCINGTNDGVVFGDVHVGTGINTPQLSDTSAEFTQFKTLSNDLDLTTKVERTVEKNTLVYDITTDGSNLDTTTELGVFSSDNETLVSRDTHEVFNVPSGSLINLKYKFTLTNNL